jgi:hypothetical protein
MDVILYREYLEYTFSPYIQLIIAFSGILSKNWERSNAAAIFTLILTLLLITIIFVKILITLFRNKQFFYKITRQQ